MGFAIGLPTTNLFVKKQQMFQGEKMLNLLRDTLVTIISKPIIEGTYNHNLN